MNAALVTAEYRLPDGPSVWISAWTDNPALAVLDAVESGARTIRVEPDEDQ